MDAKGRLGALLLGSALGAGLAMLLSPRSGPETQDRLKESARTWKDQYDEAVRKGRLRATELINSQRTASDTMTAAGEKNVSDLSEGTHVSHGHEADVPRP